MYFIEAIPAINIPREHPQILSYFSNEPIKRGSLISIPLRNKPVPAIVLSSSDISDQKTQLKKSSFSIKKINHLIMSDPIFSEKDFEFLKWFADYYVLPLGLALKTILPQKPLKAKRPIKNENLNFSQSPRASEKQKSLLLFSSNRDNLYIEEVKKTIAAKKQALVLFPEYLGAEDFFRKISAALKEEKISFLAGASTPKKYFDEWLKISGDESSIIIGTRSAIFSKFTDLGLIIIDDEHDQGYKSWDMKPYYNTRECAVKIAEIFGAKIIYGSNSPSIETYHNTATKILDNQDKNKEDNMIVNMRDEIRKGNEIISEDLSAELEKIEYDKNQVPPLQESTEKHPHQEQKGAGQAIIFINRKGTATFIFCQECGFNLKCPNCDSPLVFHKEIKNEHRQLMCHHCNFSRKAPDICPQCGGYKIKYSGIGSQKAEEFLRNSFPKLNIKRIDSDTVPTQADLKKIFTDFENKKIDVIIGTQSILKKTLPKADLIGILSIDTILNLPEFRVNERIYQIISRLKESKRDSSTPFFIQTFKPDQEIFGLSLSSNFKKIYEEEIEVREALNYPPFYQLIKVTLKHPDPKIAFSESQKMVGILEKQYSKIISQANKLTISDKNCIILGPTAGFMPRINGKYIYNIIIKTNLDVRERNLFLSIVPSKDWYIDIDPISLI